MSEKFTLDNCYAGFWTFLYPRYLGAIETSSAWSAYLDYFFKGNTRRSGVL